MYSCPSWGDEIVFGVRISIGIGIGIGGDEPESPFCGLFIDLYNQLQYHTISRFGEDLLILDSLWMLYELDM
jgi:hypothetical protein